VSATFKSPEFRASYADEYAKIYKLSESEKKKLIIDQNRAGSDYNEFIMAAHVPEENENDFSKKKSIWRMHLSVDKKRRARPAEIRKIYKKNSFLTHFFPYITPWKSVYVIRFPVKFPGTDRLLIDESVENIRLIIAGVNGSVEFTWTIKE